MSVGLRQLNSFLVKGCIIVSCCNLDCERNTCFNHLTWDGFLHPHVKNIKSIFM